jgi:hypothetical protein
VLPEGYRPPVPAAYSRAPSGVAACCTTEGFNTHKTEPREVRYGWHPWQGRQVAVRGVRTRNGLKVLSCTLDDDRGFPVLEIPEWMLDAVVCDRLERADAARVNTGALRGLRVLLDSIEPTAKEVVLEDQHPSRVQRGADAKKIEVESVGTVPGGSAEPGGTARSPSENDSSVGAPAARAHRQKRRWPLQVGGES